MEKSATKKFLIDGFPRNEVCPACRLRDGWYVCIDDAWRVGVQDNMIGWNNLMSDVVNMKFVLFLDCPTETCIDRVLERGKTSGRYACGHGARHPCRSMRDRSDDNVDTMRARLNTYERETKPIIDFYQVGCPCRACACD
jgi:UMP-CMP kinase